MCIQGLARTGRFCNCRDRRLNEALRQTLRVLTVEHLR